MDGVGGRRGVLMAEGGGLGALRNLMGRGREVGGSNLLITVVSNIFPYHNSMMII